MRKVNSIIGQDLIGLADGQRIASIKDIVVGADHESILALVVQEGGLLSDALIVPISAVRSYGPDAVVIDGASAVVEGATEPDIPNESRRTLGGMKVFSSAGASVGTVADVYFEEDDGRIVGFEISSGKVDDFASGRRFLPVEELDRVGDEIMYVRPEAAANLEPAPDSSGGAAGVMDDVASKVGDAAKQAGEKLSEVASNGSQGDQGGQTATSPGSDLIGRRSGADVTDADGRIVVANGQRISSEHVERANAAGQGEALRGAADAWSAAERERVIGGAVEQVTDAAGSAWDRFMGKMAEFTDETGKRASEQQTKARLAAINDAVGRPVTKVILDRSDEVVLNLGDIITHEAIQRAYEAGILDTLLDSVYKGDVTFERDEMKAPTEGTSTVEKASGGAVVVDELQGTVESAEAARQEASEQKRLEAAESREQRQADRDQRTQARDEAARRAAAGEPLTDEKTSSQASPSEQGQPEAASDMSFPASDPPSHSQPTVGEGDRVANPSKPDARH